MKGTKVYTVYISTSVRLHLDELRQPKRNRYPNLVAYQATTPLHLRKIILPDISIFDRRSDTLKSSKVWSTKPRPCMTNISLTESQVAFIAGLALEQGVQAWRYYGASERPVLLTKPSAVLANLIGQFVEAIFAGDLEYYDKATTATT